MPRSCSGIHVFVPFISFKAPSVNQLLCSRLFDVGDACHVVPLRSGCAENDA